MRRRIADLNPSVVAVVVVVLIMLTMVWVMLHSYVAHHIVHSLPNFFRKCPPHKSIKFDAVLIDIAPSWL